MRSALIAFAASRAARASTSVMAVELAGIAELVRLVSRLRCLDLRVGEQRSPPNTMDALGRPMHPTMRFRERMRTNTERI